MYHKEAMLRGRCGYGEAFPSSQQLDQHVLASREEKPTQLGLYSGSLALLHSNLEEKRRTDTIKQRLDAIRVEPRTTTVVSTAVPATEEELFERKRRLLELRMRREGMQARIS